MTTRTRRSRPIVVAERPPAGAPRPYDFPLFERTSLSNGLRLLTVHLPERPLVSAALVIPAGAADEPDDSGGATVLMARAMTEGTRRHDAIELVEAAERLGASIHAEAGWDATSVSLDVPAARLGPAIELLAEVAAEPTFPESEVTRLRDERLNDILQARADPRRRADEAFIETVYAHSSPYRRPSGGVATTVGRLDADVLRATHRRLFDPARMTLIVGGDLDGLDAPALAAASLGGWRRADGAAAPGRIRDDSALDGPLVRVYPRPGSVQTEIRVGHVGLPRRVPDYHAVAVMSMILGGLFGSRLNRKLREEKGYTYGAGAGFDFRRAAGPFGARAAVNTEATLPAVLDLLAEIRRMREETVLDAELADARDYLVGVFPLRFETPAAVVGALAGLVAHELPDDELTRYRDAVADVDRDDVARAAIAHLEVERRAVVLVGDAPAFLPQIEAAGLGRLVVELETGAGSGEAG